MDVQKPDQLDEKLKEFLLGNFDALPSEVIDVVVAQMDRDSLVKLCRTNETFMDYCKANNFLENKALEVIMNQAPLSGRFRTLAEQANLIKKGFSTVYNFVCENGIITKVGFGFQDDILDYVDEDNFTGEFHIPGFPSKSGTVVWVVLRYTTNRQREPTIRCSVYPDRESAVIDTFYGMDEALEEFRETGRYERNLHGYEDVTYFLSEAVLP